MVDATSFKLLEQLQKQDAAAWQEFSLLYDSMIRGWLKRQNVPSHDCDDVVQDVLTFVSQEIPKFEHNGRTGAFRRWLRMVTANRLREFWRKQSRQKSGTELNDLAEQLVDEHSEIAEQWDREHDRRLVERLMQIVSKSFQESSLQAFRQVVLEEKPAADVAEALGLTVGAVRVAQSRVLRALRDVGEGLLD